MKNVRPIAAAITTCLGLASWSVGCGKEPAPPKRQVAEKPVGETAPAVPTPPADVPPAVSDAPAPAAAAPDVAPKDAGRAGVASPDAVAQPDPGGPTPDVVKPKPDVISPAAPAADAAAAPLAPAAPAKPRPFEPAPVEIEGLTAPDFGTAAPVACSTPTPPSFDDGGDEEDEDYGEREEECCDGFELSVVGWSADGQSFGYCSEDERLSELYCELYSRFGNKVLSDLSSPDQEPEGLEEDLLTYQDRLRDRIKAMGLHCPKAEWRFAADFELQLVRRTRRAAKARATLYLRPRAAGPAGRKLPRTTAATFGTGQLIEDGSHADLGMQLGTRGRYLGLLAWTFGGEFASHELHVKVLDTWKLAEKAYLKLGKAASKAGDSESALQWYRKAAFTHAKAKKGSYELAKAMALQGHAEAPAALRLAKRRGGRRFAKRVAKDKDLREVREEAWFKELLGK